MSDDLPTNRSPKLRSEGSRNTANAEDTLLPGTLKTALLRELSPTRSQRERVQSALAATLGGAGTTSPAIEQADAEMAARAEHLHVASVAGGTSLATKVIVSSLLLASAAALTTFTLRRSEPPAIARAPIRAPSTAPQELPTPKAASVATPLAQAEPTAAPAAKIAPNLGKDSHASNSPSAAAEPPDIVSHARPRRVRAPASPPGTAPLRIDSTGQSAAENTAPAGASDVTTDPITPAAKPAPTLSAEIALVRGASDALDRRDAKSALALLTRYRQTYPAGSLAIEVQALRAIALCLDNHPRAAEACEAFLREHGKSALAGRVRSACK